MKASLKKDVIAARLITLLILVVIIAIIGSVASKVSSHKAKNSSTAEEEITSEESSEAIQIVIPEAPEATEIYVKTIKSVNLRASASADGEVLAVLPADTQMLLVSENDGWTEVMYGDQDGYVSSEFIVQVLNDTSDTSSESVETVTKTTTDNVRLRSSAGTDGEVLTTLAIGTEVQVESESDGWAKVTVNGQEGYVSSDYLQ